MSVVTKKMVLIKTGELIEVCSHSFAEGHWKGFWWLCPDRYLYLKDSDLRKPSPPPLNEIINIADGILAGIEARLCGK